MVFVNKRNFCSPFPIGAPFFFHKINRSFYAINQSKYLKFDDENRFFAALPFITKFSRPGACWGPIFIYKTNRSYFGINKSKSL